MSKKTIAVCFGGPSPEHDVSILTGLQVIESMDRTLFEPVPDYIDQEGAWWTGEPLLNRRNYHLSTALKKILLRLELPVGRAREERPCFAVASKGFFAPKKVYFDAAFMAFHGAGVEDGLIQGVFETLGIPYAGSNVLSSALYMDKSLTKAVLKGAGVPVLSETLVSRPQEGALDIAALLKGRTFSYPVCAKPCHLGSSVGVHRANNLVELQAALLDIFKMDNTALVEPFVQNLAEYNVAVTRAFKGKTTFSAVERPIKSGDFLSFKDKYLSSGDMDSKLAMPLGKGMVSATRVMNPPELTEKQRAVIYDSASKAMELVGGAGAPRIDFLCNSETGEIWLNEVNPIPGSIAYYLWEGAEPKVTFTSLITALVDEAFSKQRAAAASFDLKSAGASIFPKRD